MKICKLDIDNFEKWELQIGELVKETFISNFEENSFTNQYRKEAISNLKEHLIKGHAQVFLAIQNEKPVGWIWCHEIYRINQRRLHITSFSVCNTHRRSGIGSVLMRKAEEYAKGSGYLSLDLLVTKSNVQAIEFYKAHEFEIERLLMKKDLNER